MTNSKEARNVIDVENLEFSYGRAKPVLQIEKLQVAQGERVFLYGPSGSGKTTLLGLLAGVLTPSGGTIRLLGQDLTKTPNAKRDAFRGTHIGYIFQMFNLLPYLSVLENIILPCELHRARRKKLKGKTPKEEAYKIAEHLGIQDQMGDKVTELSVGQQQRVAAARAVIGSPEIIIADEPTSSLDADHREKFIELLFEESKQAGSTVVFVSHDRQLERLFDRSISLPEINKKTK